MKSLARSVGVVSAIVGMVIAPAAVAFGQEEEPAVVTVFHAVPADDGFPADVYLDGSLIIDGFVFETSSDSFELPAGSVTLEIFPDGSDPLQDSALVSTPVSFESGVNYSVVAQLADGSPVITIFENDTTGVGPGESRITIRQTSSASTLGVTIGDEAIVTELAQTEEASVVVSSGSVPIELATAAGDVVFAEEIDIADGVLTIFYAVGDPLENSFDLLVQEVPIAQVSPSGVPTGDGGYKTGSGWAGLGAVLVLLVVGTGWILRPRVV